MEGATVSATKETNLLTENSKNLKFCMWLDSHYFFKFRSLIDDVVTSNVIGEMLFDQYEIIFE